MKRFVTILLAVALAFSLGATAYAELESDLTAVTEHVIEVLDVSDDYEDFSGSYNDGLRPGWYLYWSKAGEDLSVTCTTAGLITDVYYWYSTESYDRFYGYDAAFPALAEDAARRQAESWLTRLAGEKERARIDDTSVSLTSEGAYSFSGRILMNGLESPVTFSIRIGTNGLESYYRSDSYKGYVGEAPAAKTGIGKADAAPMLKAAVETELCYVKDGEEARLRYVPVGAYTVVDALTGEAVDMEALYASFGSGYYGPEAPAAAEAAEMSMDAGGGMGRGLTEAELSSIANYADVLSQERLDGILRGMGDLGLGDFALNRCSYSMDEDGEITASLRYSCEMTADNLFGYSMESFWQALNWGETPMVYKHISADAKTGALISVSTSYGLWDKDDALPPEREAAERFAASAAPDMAAESEYCTLKGYNDGDGFTFARTHDGYFYPDNYLYVELNAGGTVDTYYYVWDDEVSFAPSEGIVGSEQALDACADALTVTLGYVAWPVAIDYDDPILYTYIDWGCSYAESLRLAYYYSGLDEISGVDALTGEAVFQAADGGYAYDDLEGLAEKEIIETLAAAGVGFSGGSFRPEDALTMGDAARLLLSSAGYSTDGWDDKALKIETVWEGFADAADWKPEKELSQAEFIEMLLRASRYGDAAALEGIGFGTVARALDMIDGGISEAQCTRAAAAVLLYRFMLR